MINHFGCRSYKPIDSIVAQKEYEYWLERVVAITVTNEHKN